MSDPQERTSERPDAMDPDIDAGLRAVPAGGDGGLETMALAGEAQPVPISTSFPLTPIPWLLHASGLYEWKQTFQPFPIRQRGSLRPSEPIQPGARADAPDAVTDEEAAAAQALTPWWFQREELRLDVDGRHPLMKASGTIYSGFSMRVHWIASLVKTGTDTYTGYIWFKDGHAAWLPHTKVLLQVTKSWYASQRTVTATFVGGGAPDRRRTYTWTSGFFHPVDFELDTVQNTSPVTQINTGAHPNRPAGLPTEMLSIETVFRRAGFDVTTSPAGMVPISGAGTNARWSDMEMHDAMQVYWSRFAHKPQWAMWVLFASLHDTGTSLGGIMFDDIGRNHRQGTALFNDSFIKNPPAGDPAPAAWVERMKFWTACHEMGHAFNLAHSWQKAMGTPWIPLANEPEARSFMNYPYYVSGGQHAFFADFEYRFSDGELLFMRHAPERFVQMGNADWFDDHGFQQANVSPGSPFALEVRVHRTLDYFEFLEPVVIELKLTNRSADPQIVDEAMLQKTDDMTVIIKKRGGAARQWHPYAQYCYHGARRVLEPGQSLYGSLTVAMGTNGWDLAEPGIYEIQVALHRDEEDLVSNPLTVRIAPPRSYEEEFVAQDFFSEDVGRVLTFNGSRHLGAANDTLHQVAEQFRDQRVARHARLALGNPLTRDYKLLAAEPTAAAASGQAAAKQFQVLDGKPEAARTELAEALLEKPAEAADTLGHIGYRQMVEQYSSFLADKGAPDEAASCLQKATKTLKDRKVLGRVVDDLERQRKQYASQGTSKPKTKSRKKASKK